MALIKICPKCGYASDKEDVCPNDGKKLVQIGLDAVAWKNMSEEQRARNIAIYFDANAADSAKSKTKSKKEKAPSSGNEELPFDRIKNTMHISFDPIDLSNDKVRRSTMKNVLIIGYVLTALSAIDFGANGTVYYEAETGYMIRYGASLPSIIGAVVIVLVGVYLTRIIASVVRAAGTVSAPNTEAHHDTARPFRESGEAVSPLQADAHIESALIAHEPIKAASVQNVSAPPSAPAAPASAPVTSERQPSKQPSAQTMPAYTELSALKPDAPLPDINPIVPAPPAPSTEPAKSAPKVDTKATQPAHSTQDKTQTKSAPAGKTPVHSGEERRSPAPPKPSTSGQSAKTESKRSAPVITRAPSTQSQKKNANKQKTQNVHAGAKPADSAKNDASKPSESASTSKSDSAPEHKTRVKAGHSKDRNPLPKVNVSFDMQKLFPDD